MQSPEIHKKAISAAFHRKKIFMSSNGEYKWVVQGYEPFCIRDLLKDYEPADIIAGEGQNVPICPYIFNDKHKIWHPDIYIKSKNIIIEVKSTFTYTKYPKQMLAKMNHCKYNCELWIYNRDGSIFEILSRDVETGDLTYLYGKVILGDPLY